MAVAYFPEERLFKLSTSKSDYIFYVAENSRIYHIYYGSRLSDTTALIDMQNIIYPASFSPLNENEDSHSSPDCRFFEFSGVNSGDYRITSAAIKTADGATCCSPKYVSHSIYHGKKRLETLPSSFAGAHDDCDTLKIIMQDKASGVEFVILYSVFENSDVIVRSVKAVNRSDKTVKLERLMSLQLDLPHYDFDMVNLAGSWFRERNAERTPLHHGIQMIRSVRGSSSHQNNPALALMARNASENTGDVYGFMLAYSSNFSAEVEVEQFSSTRIVMGIETETFEWTLEPGTSFESPEAYMTYSANGLGAMTRSFHDFIRDNVISTKWSTRKRPILINNWEATYFNFNDEKILAIAKTASELGIEMLVLDDGWFGKRNSDNSSLGDWFVNTDKIGDLGELVKSINALGLKFGLWFEPEMISPESELYKKHPEWALHIPDREKSIGRNQMLLDMSRQDVIDYLFDTISNVLKNANIEYVKWDMNRNLTEVFSTLLPADRQGEVFHRNVMGVYKLHAMLLNEFPDLLIEGCSGGGGRFDAGMMTYTPQIWCSDDTDAIERLNIQGGTSIFYPASAMGAHVSVCPNHGTKRMTPFTTRGHVAMAGTFGYELDLTKLSEEDRETVKLQCNDYHKYHDIIANGSLYRLSNVFDTNAKVTAWMNVSNDKSRAVATFIRRRCDMHNSYACFKLRGLEKTTLYKVSCDDQLFTAHGDTLMNHGIYLKALANQDGAGAFYVIEKV